MINLVNIRVKYSLHSSLHWLGDLEVWGSKPSMGEIFIILRFFIFYPIWITLKEPTTYITLSESK